MIIVNCSVIKIKIKYYWEELDILLQIVTFIGHIFYYTPYLIANTREKTFLFLGL